MMRVCGLHEDRPISVLSGSAVSAAPPVEPTPPAPKNRYERLENRISRSFSNLHFTVTDWPADELESLLRDKSDTDMSPPAGDGNTPSSSGSAALNDFGVLPTGDSTILGNGAMGLSSYFPHDGVDGMTGIDYPFPDSPNLDHLTGLIGPSHEETSHVITASTASSDSGNAKSNTSVSPPSDPSLSLLYLSWPATLPDIITTRHL